jgi:O-antigen ligase
LYFTNLDFGRSSNELLLFFLVIVVVPSFSLIFLKNYEFLKGLETPLIIVFSLTSILIILGGEFASDRLSGNLILNPITSGHIAVSGLILILSSALGYAQNIRLHTVTILSFSIILLLTVMMSASRGPMLSLLIVAVVMLFYKVSLKKIILIIIASIFLISIYMIILSDTSLIQANRFSVDFGSEGGGGEARVLLWKTGVDIFLQNPFFGGNTTTTIGYVHNIFIEVMHSMGMIGTLLFSFLLFRVFKTIYLLLKYKHRMAWVGFLFIQHFIASLLSGNIYSSDYFWYLFVILLGIGSKLSKKYAKTGDLRDA